jgi:hypothetical protein
MTLYANMDKYRRLEMTEELRVELGIGKDAGFYDAERNVWNMSIRGVRFYCPDVVAHLEAKEVDE